MKKAVIVLPTFNEAKNIESLVEEIFAEAKKINGWDIEILVVDSTSPDGTANVVEKLTKKYNKLHLLNTPKEGLGKAYTRGFEFAMNRLSPYIIFEMDADHSHSPKKIKEFLKKIEEGADFVIGSRYIKGGSIPADWGIHRKLFSVLGNLIIRLGFMKISISDWTSGFRAIKAWLVQSVTPKVKRYSGYVFQVAIIDNALKKNAKMAEVPINFIDRKHGVSKINSIQYIIQTLMYVFTHSSFVRYGIVGVIGAVIDFGLSHIFIDRMHMVIWVATLISAEGAIISNFFLNNFWSFEHKRLEAKAETYMSKFIKFNVIASGALAIQAIGIQTFANFFGRRWWFIYKAVIILIVIIPYSYILYNKVIWKDKHKN